MLVVIPQTRQQIQFIIISHLDRFLYCYPTVYAFNARLKPFRIIYRNFSTRLHFAHYMAFNALTAWLAMRQQLATEKHKKIGMRHFITHSYKFLFQVELKSNFHRSENETNTGKGSCSYFFMKLRYKYLELFEDFCSILFIFTELPTELNQHKKSVNKVFL